jgi:hypothetical protein
VNEVRDRAITSTCWARLMTLVVAATCAGVGEATVREWISASSLEPVPMPSSTLIDHAGKVMAQADHRRIAESLTDRADLDRLFDQRKGAS